jgi:hypothetical protein
MSDMTEDLRRDLGTIVRAWLDWLAGEDIPVSDWARVHLQTEGSSWQLIYESGPALYPLFWMFQSNFLAITPVEDLGTILSKVRKIASPAVEPNDLLALDFDNYFMKAWFWHALLEPVLRQATFQDGRFQLGDDAVSEITDRFSKAAESPSMLFVRTITPLIDCEIEPDYIEVAPGVNLRRVPAEELGRWYDHPAFRELAAKPQFAGCAIELNYRVSPDGYDDLRHKALASVPSERYQDSSSPIQVSLRAMAMADQEIGRVLAVLRLATNRDLHPMFTISDQSSLFNLFSSATSLSLPPVGSLTRLSQDDCKKVKEVWNQIVKGTNGERADLAIKRWSIARDRWPAKYRDRLGDMLIDYWIAFESLFCPDSTAELQYNEMKTSYKWRSLIVHGSRNAEAKLENRSPLALVVSTTGVRLREAILRIIELKDRFDAATIEEDLLRGAPVSS